MEMVSLSLSCSLSSFFEEVSLCWYGIYGQQKGVFASKINE